MVASRSTSNVPKRGGALLSQAAEWLKVDARELRAVLSRRRENPALLKRYRSLAALVTHRRELLCLISPSRGVAGFAVKTHKKRTRTKKGPMKLKLNKTKVSYQADEKAFVVEPDARLVALAAKHGMSVEECARHAMAAMLDIMEGQHDNESLPPGRESEAPDCNQVIGMDLELAESAATQSLESQIELATKFERWAGQLRRNVAALESLGLGGHRGLRDFTS